jgi:hypothetical protein
MRALFASAVLAAFALGCVTVREPQLHMRAALDHLSAARRALADATATKGGHRARALALVERAIEQTRRGMEYDARD